MNIRDIVEDWLKTHGYDGLAGDECGCRVDDLMPCGCPHEIECKPGYLVPIPEWAKEAGADCWLSCEKPD